MLFQHLVIVVIPGFKSLTNGLFQRVAPLMRLAAHISERERLCLAGVIVRVLGVASVTSVTGITRVAAVTRLICIVVSAVVSAGAKQSNEHQHGNQQRKKSFRGHA